MRTNALCSADQRGQNVTVKLTVTGPNSKDKDECSETLNLVEISF